MNINGLIFFSEISWQIWLFERGITIRDDRIVKQFIVSKNEICCNKGEDKSE